MTLDEAIEQFKYDAECNRADLDLSYAEDNEQLAEWLEELKELRNMTAGHLYAVAFNRGYLKAEKEVREKTIDDFVKEFNRKTSMENKLIEEIAEQLKAGEDNA